MLYDMLAEQIKSKIRIDVIGRGVGSYQVNHTLMHRVHYEHLLVNRSEAVCISIIKEPTNPLLGRIIVFESSSRHDPDTKVFDPADPNFSIDEVVSYAKQMAQNIRDRQTS